MTTGQKLPPLNWDLINRNGYHGYCANSVYLHYFNSIGALSVLNIEKKRAYYIVRNGLDLPWWFSGSPLQTILHVWLREYGMQLTHSAAVGNGQTAVLLVGKGRSGKSTTTLACLTQGLYYLGEDYCIVAPGKVPQVFSLYQSAKWELHTRKLFPSYEHFIVNPDTADEEKALVYYQNLFPAQVKISSPVRAIVSLKIGNTDRPIIQKYDLQSTLKNLMMSTLRQLPFYHPSTLNILKTFSLQVVYYQLSLGRDMKANAQAIQEILGS